jgi:CheY-like chemotaxis protein
MPPFPKRWLPVLLTVCGFQTVVACFFNKKRNACLSARARQVNLPSGLPIPENQNQSDAPAAKTKSTLMSKKILLAEDDEDIRFILNLVLQEAGYVVEPLPAGTPIVEKRDEWPDLFILDKALPTIDGLAICKYLKIQKETRDIPIIMISSYHELRSKAREVGADDFIEKPFDLKVFLSLVEKHLKNSEQLRTV